MPFSPFDYPEVNNNRKFNKQKVYNLLHMVSGGLVDRILACFGVIVLAANMGCAAMQKGSKIRLPVEQHLGCTTMHYEKGAYRCGDITYTLANEEREDFGAGISVTIKRVYKTKFGDRLITEQMEGKPCPQRIEIQTSDGYLQMELDDACKVWSTRMVNRSQILFQ